MSTRGRFITPKTAGFIRHITSEFMDQHGQSIILYQLDAEKTDMSDKNHIYRESDTKRYKTGKRLQAVVDITPKQYENLQDVGYELKNEITVNFHIHDLKKKDVFPSIGDIISFQELFYEIYDTDDSSMLHGSPEYKYMYTCECHDIRLNDYDIPIQNDLEVDDPDFTNDS